MVTRLLIKAHLLRCPLDPSLRRTLKYASVGHSRAPCIWNLSQQPELEQFVNKLLGGEGVI